MPLALKEKARLDARYLREVPPAEAMTAALRSTLASAEQGARADAAFAWGNPSGRFLEPGQAATVEQGAKADAAYAWGDHAGLYVPIVSGSNVAAFENRRNSGVNGGIALAETWVVRRMTTAAIGGAGASLVSEAGYEGCVDLEAGTYWLSAWATAYNVGEHRVRLYQVSAPADTLRLGSSEYAGAHSSRSTVQTVAVFAAPTRIRLDHWMKTATDNKDRGRATNQGQDEIYAGLTCWRLS